MKDQLESKDEDRASSGDLDAAKEELQKAKAEAEKYKAELDKTKFADKTEAGKSKGQRRRNNIIV